MREKQESVQESDQDQVLSELRKEISIQSSTMMHIVQNDDQFIEKLKELNDSGIACILKGCYLEGLIYLQEAEKMLEFAANCGKTIDRILIIFTLQNQACVYQRLWDFEKASSYLQAIIFNMNSYAESVPEIIMMSEIVESFSQSYNDFSILICKRQQIATNFLKFSAINSQLKKHEIALDSAFKALGILKQICQECYNYERYSKKTFPTTLLKEMLKQLSSVKQIVQIRKTHQYFLLAQKYLTKLKSKQIDSEHKKQIQRLSKFSIGELMQVCPTSLHQLQTISTLEEEVSYLQKMYKAIYISICYFTIATELRFICDEKYGQIQKKKAPQFLRSKLFHLNAIIVGAKYLPKKIQYLQHIMISFTNHYEVSLQELIDSNKDDQIEQKNIVMNVDRMPTQSKVLKPFKFNNNNLANQNAEVKTPRKDEKKKGKNKSSSKKTKERFSGDGCRMDNPLLSKYNLMKGKRLFIDNKEKQRKKLKSSPLRYKLTRDLPVVKTLSKSNSKSKKEISHEKAAEKKFKTNVKLSEEYFTKNKKKKSLSKGLNKIKPQESMKGSISKQQSKPLIKTNKSLKT